MYMAAQGCLDGRSTVLKGSSITDRAMSICGLKMFARAVNHITLVLCNIHKKPENVEWHIEMITISTGTYILINSFHYF